MITLSSMLEPGKYNKILNFLKDNNEKIAKDKWKNYQNAIELLRKNNQLVDEQNMLKKSKKELLKLLPKNSQTYFSEKSKIEIIYNIFHPSSASIKDLPPELIEKIVKDLSENDISNLGKTSKQLERHLLGILDKQPTKLAFKQRLKNLPLYTIVKYNNDGKYVEETETYFWSKDLLQAASYIFLQTTDEYDGSFSDVKNLFKKFPHYYLNEEKLSEIITVFEEAFKNLSEERIDETYYDFIFEESGDEEYPEFIVNKLNKYLDFKWDYQEIKNMKMYDVEELFIDDVYFFLALKKHLKFSPEMDDQPLLDMTDMYGGLIPKKYRDSSVSYFISKNTEHNMEKIIEY